MISIKVPPLGESIVEATISRWLKNEGDAVASGETLVELETDKITVEVPALKAGTLAKRLKNEGDVVKVDEALGELDESGAGAASGAAKSADAKPADAKPADTKPAEAKPAAASTPASPAPTPPAPMAAQGEPPRPEQAAASQGAPSHGGSGTAKVSPAAQRVATERGVDVSQVSGTGRGGVISKPDVIEQAGTAGAKQAAASSQPQASQAAPRQAPSAPKPSSDGQAAGDRETREKMTTRRKRIAENLLQAKQATANLTTFNEVDMSAVSAFREKHKESVEKKHGAKLSFMPFFVKAACMALKDIPIINAQIDGDSIVYKHYVNMGIAVASDAGLIVPNIKDADQKGLIELSLDIAAVAKKARDGKLTMDDLTGGTFTITNGGVFGSLVSTPILNHPQVGILGLHKIQDRPVVVDGQIVIRPMMYIALTYDHRIVDGQHSVLFLVRLKELLEDPASMLIA